MEDLKIDYTLFFSRLEMTAGSDDLKTTFGDVFYSPASDESFKLFENFIETYHTRLTKNTITPEDSLQLMRKTNPRFVLRNYILFECIAELEQGKRHLFNKILTALESPYEELFPEFSKKRPAIYDDQSGSSTLSCSS